MSTIPNDPNEKNFDQNRDSIDLSELKDICLQPKWHASPPRKQDHSDRQKRSKPPHRKREREQKDFPRSNKPRHSAFTDPVRQQRGSTRPIFIPTVDVKFYPEEAPFQSLGKVIRSSCRTYELFEISQLILQKPERFVVSIKPLPKKDKEGKVLEEKKLYISVPDGMPFESDADAIGHVLKNHLDKFFDVEEVTVEAPKGNFQVINKCGITGELLGPPNYHRYPDLLKEHYISHFSHLPYEKFISKIETIRDEEQVKTWLEKMSKQHSYNLKNIKEGQEPLTLNSIEAVRNYFIKNCKDQIVQEVNSIRLPGKVIEEIPSGNIKRAVFGALEHQKRFPLDTANSLRGVLRHMNFVIYKKGSHGVSYVSAVKRRFRAEDTVLAENLAKLIDFIEKNVNLTAMDLPKAYLGVETTKQVEPVTATVEGEEASTEQPTSEKIELSPEDEEKVRRLMLDLRWLVTEGYVTEYGDGHLYAPPVQKGTKPPISAKDVAEEKMPLEKALEDSEAKETVIPADEATLESEADSSEKQ